jgi:hypothetical protein
VEELSASRGIAALRQAARKNSIAGTYTKRGNAVEVILRLVTENADSNTIVKASVFSIPLVELEKWGIALLPDNNKTEEEVAARDELFAPIKPAAQNLIAAASDNDGGGITLDVWPNSDTRTYYEGEKLVITLFADRDCYVKLYHVDVDNKLQLIFPYQNKNNKLSANRAFSPPETYLLGAPFGRETIIALASPTQFENLDAELARQKSAETRGLTVKAVTDMASGAEATARFDFTILPIGRAVDRD